MGKAIIGLGEILWDMLPAGKQLGGAPANFAYHVCRLGGEGWAVSAIGKDANGQEIKDTLGSKKLNTLLSEVDFPTGTVEVTLNEKGVPTYNIIEGVAWDNIPFTPEMEKLAESCAAVCFGSLAQRNSISRKSILKFIQSAPVDALKIFDINLRQHYYTKEIIQDSLAMADILKINDEELDIVSELIGFAGSSTEKCHALISGFNLSLVILTKGAEGSDIVTMSEVLSHGAGDVEVVDTVGAGDSFTAAFTLSYLNGESLEAALKLASETAAYVCTKHGAMPE